MSTSAWVMLLIGSVLLYGGLIASLSWAVRRTKQQKQEESERDSSSEKNHQIRGSDSK